MRPTLLLLGSVLLLSMSGSKVTAQVSITDSLNYEPIGKLFDIGGYRLHLNGTGKGKYTVILISGAFGFSFDWTMVQRELSREAKVCSYDRPGLAWSDMGPMPHTLDQDAYELHKLLKVAKIKPPYILVGQSIGGLIARKYAREYRGEVNGMVLVDATSENGLFGVKGKIERLRLLAAADKKILGVKERVDTFTKRTAEEKIRDFLKSAHIPTVSHSDQLQDSLQNLRSWAQALPKYATAEGGEYWAEEFAGIYADSLSYRLADKPLVVLTSVKNEYPTGWDMRDSMMNEKLRNQKNLLNLSANSKLITTENSGHEIHTKEPNIVIQAVKQVIQAIKNKSRLE